MKISDYIGLEFEPLGRGPRYDCWGLVAFFYSQEFGIQLPRFHGDYMNVRDSQAISGLVDSQKSQGDWVPAAPGFGNVIVFNIAGRPTHVGVTLDQRKFLHIEKGKNSVIEQFTARKWNPRIERCYRHRKR